MKNAGLDEAQAGIKIAGRNINNFIYAVDATLMAESEQELKSLLMKVKEESEKAGLKLKKTKIMASGPIILWQINGETMKTVSDFNFLGSKITADGDCSHEIKRCLLLGRKAMTNLDSVYLKTETSLHLKRSVQSKLWYFQQSCMDVKVGLYRKLSAEELMLLNCYVGEDSQESLGLQEDQSSLS